jgi:hypothetical protein
MKLNVHIEHLVIDDPGAGPLRRDRLQAAVHAEIERQLRTTGLAGPVQPRTTERPVDGGLLPVTGSRGPEQIGRHVGRAVFRSIAE